MIMSRPAPTGKSDRWPGGVRRVVFGVLVRVVPTLFSGYVWLACVALMGSWFLLAASLLLVVVLVMGGRRWRPLFTWRHGVRAATPQEVEAVWAALVPVQQLRGRGQPGVWIDTAGRTGVEALTHRDLAVPQPVVVALLRGRHGTVAFCAAVCWSFGVRRVRGEGVAHALAELFWLPSSILTTLAGGAAGRFVRLPLIRTAWTLRIIYIPMLIWHAWVGPGFGYRVAAAVVVALTYLVPWWRRCYDDELVRAGDAEVLRCGLGPVWAAQLRRVDRSLATEQRATRLGAAAERRGAPDGPQDGHGTAASAASGVLEGDLS